MKLYSLFLIVFLFGCGNSFPTGVFHLDNDLNKSDFEIEKIENKNFYNVYFSSVGNNDSAHTCYGVWLKVKQNNNQIFLYEKTNHMFCMISLIRENKNIKVVTTGSCKDLLCGMNASISSGLYTKE